MTKCEVQIWPSLQRVVLYVTLSICYLSTFRCLDISIPAVEVIQGTPQVYLHCNVKGVLVEPTDINWTVDNSTFSSNSVDDRYSVTDGIFSDGAISSTLAIKSADQDKMFTCNVEVPAGTFSVEQKLKVFDVVMPDRSLSMENYETLTCKIKGISRQAAVVWECNTVDLDETKPNYFIPNSGTWDLGNQKATLLIKPSKLRMLEKTSLFTCKITLGSGDVQSKTMTLTKNYEAEVESSSVTCDGLQIKVYFTGWGVLSHIHLLDTECKYPGTASEVGVPFTGCGTLVQTNETHIVYTNTVFGVIEEYLPGQIIRRDNLRIPFTCTYETLADNLPEPGTEEISVWDISDGTSGETPDETSGEISVEGEGSFDIFLDLYKADNFSQKFERSQYPVTLSLRDYVFLGVSLITPDYNLELQVEEIIASDSLSTSDGSYSYSLVHDGCIVDSTLRFIDEYSDKISRKFSLKAFHFMNTQSVVYMHAFVRVCNSANETCSEDCTKVKKRSADSPTNLSKQFHIFQGPLVGSSRSAPPQLQETSGSYTLRSKFTKVLTLLYLSIRYIAPLIILA